MFGTEFFSMICSGLTRQKCACKQRLGTILTFSGNKFNQVPNIHYTQTHYLQTLCNRVPLLHIYKVIKMSDVCVNHLIKQALSAAHIVHALPIYPEKRQ